MNTASHSDEPTLISRRVRALPGSVVRGIFDRASALEREGKSIIHLEIGRPWHDTPAFIKEAAKAALDKGFVHYSPTHGIGDLRSEIANKLRRENGIEADPESEILVTCGNKQATFLALNALVNPGDEVIITDPHYGPHLKEALYVGASPKLLPLSRENGWRLDGDLLKSLVGPKTRVIVINTPHNPTGRVFTEAELRQVAEIAYENDLVVITDETYEYFAYDGRDHISIASFDGMKERTVSTFAFTKSYAMDGWRLGYMVAPKAVIAAVAKLVQLDTAGPNTFAQYGAIEAVRSGRDGARSMVLEDLRARDMALERLSELALPCAGIEGTIYAFPEVGHLGMDGEQFAQRLLEERGVALTPGSAFGKQGNSHVRIAFGAVSPQNLGVALDRLAQFVSEIRSGG